MNGSRKHNVPDKDQESGGLSGGLSAPLFRGVTSKASLGSRGSPGSVPKTSFALPGALFRDAAANNGVQGTGTSAPSGGSGSGSLDGTGNTKTEIDNLMQELDLTEEQIDHFRDCFNLFDKDGNGEVDVEELETALMSLGQM